ncbi:hypothetical protein [Kribbella sp. NPDC000426]|uniref:hypothetical protein n=1 Tax=Kribbella sp. NPDC000426 TaxID=3154255 RepID=UPI00332C8CC3
MLKQTTRRRPSSATRRTGYAAAIVVNAAMLYAIHSWPGWQQVPFLTASTTQVLGWVTATLIAGLAGNLVYLWSDPPWLKSLGDLVITGIGLVAIIRVWQVFPFDFGTASFDWAVLVRIALAVGFFGSIAAMIVQVVVLVADGARVRHAAGTP